MWARLRGTPPQLGGPQPPNAPGEVKATGPGPGPPSRRGLPSARLGVSSRPCVPALQTEAPENATSAVLGPLASSTTYTVRVTCLHPGGHPSTMTGRLTTREWAVWGLQAALCPSAPMDT